MLRNYWDGRHLRQAAKLLSDAADNLYTAYPDSPSSPCPQTLPAVKAMIAAAQDSITAAQPETEAARQAVMAKFFEKSRRETE